MRKAITLGLVIAPLAGLVLTSCEKWAPSFRGTHHSCRGHISRCSCYWWPWGCRVNNC